MRGSGKESSEWDRKQLLNHPESNHDAHKNKTGEDNTSIEFPAADDSPWRVQRVNDHLEYFSELTLLLLYRLARLEMLMLTTQQGLCS